MAPKKKRKLSAWNIFIKENSHLAKFKLPSGSPDLTKMSEAFQGKKSTKAKPKKKTTTTRKVSTMTKSKPEKKTRKTAKQKSTSRNVPVSALEKRSQKLFDRVEQVRLALSIPRGKATIKMTSKSTSIKMGGMKTIKRRKFSDVVKILEERARRMI